MIGREFDHALLLQIAPVDDATLQTELEQLIAADLVYRQRRVHGDSYIFRHALIRDAAYEAMPRNQREETHERIAQTLAGGSKAEVERNLARLAMHYGMARRFTQAVRYGIDAANRALIQATYQDACELCAQIQGWAEHLSGAERMEAMLAASRIATNALMQQFGWSDSRVKRSAKHAQVLLQEAREITNLNLKFPLASLWSLAIYHHVLNERDVTRGLCEQLQTLSAGSQDLDLLLIYHTLHGNACWIDGEMAQARTHFEFVEQHYQLEQHRHHGNLYGLDTGVWSKAALSNICFVQDDPLPQVLAMADATLELAQQTGHPASIGLACMYKMNLLIELGEREEVGQLAALGLDMALKYGLPAIQAYCAIRDAWVKDDIAGIDMLTGMLCQLGCVLAVPQYRASGAQLAFARGDTVDAIQRLDDAIRMAEGSHEHYYIPTLYLMRAQYAQHSAVEQSRRDAQHALVLAQKQGATRIVRLAEQLRTGHTETVFPA